MAQARQTETSITYSISVGSLCERLEIPVPDNANVEVVGPGVYPLFASATNPEPQDTVTITVTEKKR